MQNKINPLWRPYRTLRHTLAGFGVFACVFIGDGAAVDERFLGEITTSPLNEVEENIHDKHPATYLFLASRVFGERSHDEGVKWFYIAQLRYRFHLAAHPELDPSGDGALFASLMSNLGPLINRHAGKDPDRWIELIDEAIVWDQNHPNGFTSKTEYAEAYSEVIEGLKSLQESIEERRQEILDRDKMPSDWPKIRMLGSLSELEGSFERGRNHYLVPRLFAMDQITPELRSKTVIVRLQVAPDSSENSLQVMAYDDEGSVIKRNTLHLEPMDGGFGFVDSNEDQLGGVTREVVTKTTFFRNLENDLVFSWDFRMKTLVKGATLPIEESSVSWQRVQPSTN